MVYQILKWDSDFFDFKVARISQANLDLRALSDILAELKGENVRLCYWAADREWDQNIISRLGGRMTDLKTTFVVALGKLDFNKSVPVDIVETFSDSMPRVDFENLAIQCGEYSRFSVDPDFPREKFVALYHTWIEKSLRKEIARETLVIRDGEKVTGMVTLGEKNERGDIGLIAVDKNYRGKKFGEKLVRAAQKWFLSQGFETGQVVTQGRNMPACALYKRCDYSIESQEYFYHFWL